MPNWLPTTVVVRPIELTPDSARQLLDFTEQLRASEEMHPHWGREFVSMARAFAPLPPRYYELAETDTLPSGMSAKVEIQRETYGTKWGDCQSEIVDTTESSVTIQTEFPWNIGFRIFHRVVDRFPLLQVIAEWHDPFDDSDHGGVWQHTEAA